MTKIKKPIILYRDEQREIIQILNKIYHVDRIKPESDVKDVPNLVERLKLDCYDKNVQNFFKPTPLYEDSNPYTEAEERAIIQHKASRDYFSYRVVSHNLKDILNYCHFFNIELRKTHYDYVRFITLNVNREYLFAQHKVLPYEYDMQIKWMIENVFIHQGILGISIEKGKQKLNPYLHYHIIFYQPPRKTKKWIRKVKHLLNPHHNKFYPMTPNPVVKESELNWGTLQNGLLYFLGVTPRYDAAVEKLKGDVYKCFIHRHILKETPSGGVTL